MKTSASILSLCLAGLPLLSSAPSHAQAQPRAGAPTANSEHLSSNTVRAKFRGLQDMPSAPHSPRTSLHAIFEVTESLAYQIDAPHGSPRLEIGDQFSVNLEPNLYGQPNEVSRQISMLREGDSAVMLMSTLFLDDQDGQAGGRIIRPCVRFAADNPSSTPPAQPNYGGYPQLPDPNQVVTPRRNRNRGNYREVSINITNGRTERIERSRAYDPNTDSFVERLFINGVEVDPYTRQPIQGNQQGQPYQLPSQDREYQRDREYRQDREPQQPAQPAPQQPRQQQQQQHGPTEAEKKGLSF